VIGQTLLALGLLITARDIWLGFTYWSAFGPKERIRFVFWLWAGMVLTLAGAWLAFRLRAAGWAAGIVILFPVLLWALWS
jgi:hypothetical protein